MLVKQKPEDFIVEEVLDLNTEERGDYAYFILKKKNWATLKALHFLAKQLHMNVKRFAVAGQKDRQGITKQHVSAYRVSERTLENVKMKDITLTFVGYGKTPIALGQLKGNRFTITVRDVKKPLHALSAVANYYDEQRFGGYRPNLHRIGKEILKGNYETAVKMFLLYPFPSETQDHVIARTWMEEHWGEWNIHTYPRHMINERMLIGHLEKHPGDFKGALKALPRQLFTMTTQAYQSYLFNESLARYLKQTYKHYSEVPYALGTLVFVDEYLDVDWPIVGYESKLEGDVKNIVEGLMKEEDVWYDTFHCEIPALSSPGLTRKAMIKVEDFRLGALHGGVQEVSFFLPKGSYATVVMKALSQDVSDT